MNYRKKTLEKWLKSSFLLFAVIAVCGIMIACPNSDGSTDNRSKDNSIKDLLVNGDPVDGTSPDFTASVYSGVDEAEISFVKPAKSTASFRIIGGATTSFNNKAEPLCAVPDVPFDVGNNYFEIDITSERGVRETYHLTVTRAPLVDVPVTSITLTPATLDIYLANGPTEGSPFTLDIQPGNASEKAVTWSSNRTAVATVDSLTGQITPVGSGTAIITVTANDGSGVKGTATITVIAPSYSLNGLTVSGTTVEGVSPAFTADVANDVTSVTISFNKETDAFASIRKGTNGNILDNFPIGPTTCSVSSDTLNTGINEFTITITYANNFSMYYYLKITKAAPGAVYVTSVSLSPKTARLNLNTEAYSNPFTPAVVPDFATNPNVIWSVEPQIPAVASINSTSGAITTLTRGTTTIKALAADGSGYSDTAELTVVSTDSSISDLTVTATTVGGDSPNFIAGVGSTANSVNISFNKAPGSTATIMVAGSEPPPLKNFPDPNDNSCPVTGVPLDQGPNYFIITVTPESGSTATSYNLTITKAAPADIMVTSITLDAQADLIIDYERSLDQYLHVNPATATNPNVIWSSDKPEVATVNASGLVTAVARGTATITATPADGGNGTPGTTTIKVVSTERNISNLTVNNNNETGSSSPYTAAVLNSVTAAIISFDKPDGAIADFRITSSGTILATFNDPDIIACTVPITAFSANPFIVGDNIYTITVTPESGLASDYTLIINRSSAATGAFDFEIKWEGGDNIFDMPSDLITLNRSSNGAVLLKLITTASGPFKWYVDGAEQIGVIGNSFEFSSVGRDLGTYNIAIRTGSVGGDALKIKVE